MTYSTGLPIFDASKGWVDPRFIALKDILTLTKILNGDDFMNRKKMCSSSECGTESHD